MKEENNLPAILGPEKPYGEQFVVVVLVIITIFAMFDAPEYAVMKAWELATEGRCPKLEGLGGECVYLHEHILASGARVIPSFVAAVIAMVFVLLGSMFTIFGLLLRCLATALIALPATAAYFVFLHMFGFGEISKMLGMAMIGLSTQLLFTVYAVREFLYGRGTETTQWEALYRQLQMDGVGRPRLIWEHMIPLLAPRFFNGLTIVAGFVWKVTILFEFVGSSGKGVGYLLSLSIKLGSEEGTHILYAGILVVMCLSGLTISLVYFLKQLHARRVFRFKVPEHMRH